MVKKTRPSRRDDRWLLVLAKLYADQEPGGSIVPTGRTYLFTQTWLGNTSCGSIVRKAGELRQPIADSIPWSFGTDEDVKGWTNARIVDEDTQADMSEFAIDSVYSFSDTLSAIHHLDRGPFGKIATRNQE
jgi:hypothetical protein